MDSTVTFEDQIAQNKRRSFFLVFLLVLFAGVVGGVFTSALVNDPDAGIAGGIGTLVVAGVVAVFTYYSGGKILMTIAGADELQKSDDPELYNVVEELAIAAGTSVPRIFKIPDTAMNAFATGRDPQHAMVAITTGLRDKLTRDELQGVLAHELGHVVNYDIRLTMLIAVVAGLIVLLCDAFWRMLRVNRGGRRSSSSSSKDGGGVLAIVVIIALVLAFIAPFISKLLQLAVSREREYLADATAVRLTRNPLGLANALRKLGDDTEPLEAANRATEHLYIVSPTRKLLKADIDSVWSTHPPIRKRVERLLALAS